MIRLTVPDIDEDDVSAVRNVLVSGFLVQGQHVAAFEEAVAREVGAAHAVAVNSCTSALHLSLLALGIGPGDAVAVSSYSWPATANVVAIVGARPVFVDIDPTTMNLDPSALAQTLGAERITAVLAVHAFGNPADMERVCELSSAAGATVVEDAACALGASIAGRQAGRWGKIGCYSFHPRKAVTTGEGGVVVTDDDEVADKVRMFRNHGLNPHADSPTFDSAGYNLRLTELQAALGRSQLRKLSRIIDGRRLRARVYDHLLEGTDLEVPRSLDGAIHVYQSYVVRLPRAVATRRPRIIAHLRTEGIETAIGTYHIPMTRFFRSSFNFAEGDFPATDEVNARAMTLPLYPTLSLDEQRFVVDRLLTLIDTLDGT